MERGRDGTMLYEVVRKKLAPSPNSWKAIICAYSHNLDGYNKIKNIEYSRKYKLKKTPKTVFTAS